MKVMTPYEFAQLRSPDVDYILERINSYMSDTGECNMRLQLAGRKHNKGILDAVNRKLVDAGWIVKRLEVICDDRPCASPSLEISLDIPLESTKK